MGTIRASKITIADEVRIADDVQIDVSDSVYISPYVVIRSGFRARGRNLFIGRHSYIDREVEIGLGGSNSLNANVFIDDYVGIFERTTINCADSVHIGKYCGLGQEVKIWTHGTWLPVIDGFPGQHQAPVWIGDKVWLPARTQVMQGVTVGNNVVVGINSLVNKSLPDGCFAAGIPAKVIKANVYPNVLSDDVLTDSLMGLCDAYVASIAPDRGFVPRLEIKDCCVTFSYLDESVMFNVRTSEFTPCPHISCYAEDFRNYLRRNGYKFYGGGFFCPMFPLRFSRERVVHQTGAE